MAQSYDPVARLSELISGIEIGILTTISPDHNLHSCPMSAHGVEAPGVLWFLSSSETDKVESVKTMQRVNVCFADHAGQRYVSVSGFCELVRDRAKAKQLWHDSYQAWLPGGVDDPNLILMKIDVQQAEYWSAAEKRMVQLLGFNKPAIQ
jgi:general stress protein 26